MIYLLLTIFFSIMVFLCFLSAKAKQENEKLNNKIKLFNQNFDFIEQEKVTMKQAFIMLINSKKEAYNPSKDKNRIKMGLEEDSFK